jgi:uncharacterized membrane protein
MIKVSYMSLSVLVLLLASKLSSSFTNVSPFIATVIFAVYFIKDKYYLLFMIFISQALSDIIYGTHISNIFVYLSYALIVLFLYKSKKEINLFNSLVSSIYVNGIFFTVSNLGHYVFFSESYTVAALLMSYTQAVPFGWNLMLSTVLFIGVYHLLLAVNKKRLVKA